MLEEFSLEDRINDEVRVILEAYSDEMRRSGCSETLPQHPVRKLLVRQISTGIWRVASSSINSWS